MPAARGAVAIFVKTPGYSPVKSRLAATAGTALATAMYEQCVRVTAAVVRRACAEAGMQTYWAVAEAAAQRADLWRDFPIVAQGEGELGTRMAAVYAQLQPKHGFVLFVGADCPHMPARCLSDAARLLLTREVAHPDAGQQGADFVLGPAMDGGFYLFGGRLAIPTTAWTAVQYSQPRAAADLGLQICGLGRVHTLDLHLTDLDSAADLQQMRAEKPVCEQLGYTLLPEQLAWPELIV